VNAQAIRRAATPGVSAQRIRHAASDRATADIALHQAVAQAYGTLTIAEIMEAAGVTRPTVYAILRRAGVTLKGQTK
jgi:AcrR family transcriptional regulator